VPGGFPGYGFTASSRACDDSRPVPAERFGASWEDLKMAITTRWRLAAAVLSIGLLSAACGTNTEKPAATGGAIPAAPTTTDPRTFQGSNFYATPPAAAGSAHGDLVSYQEITLQGLTGAKAWRVLYRSVSVRDQKPIVVSGMVIAPTAEAVGQRPMIAWAHPTVGSADVCAPSKTFTGKALTTDPSEAALLDQLQFFIRQGYVVVATDYEGLGTEGPHPFLVGESEGRGVLDSLLAARQMTQLNAGDTTVIYGLSQGGQAALFAGELATTWAPDLKVAGVVAAAPFSEVDLLLPFAASSPDAAAYYVLGVYGQAAANKSLNVGQVLDPVAAAQGAAVESQCLTQIRDTYKNLLTTSGKSSFMTTNPLTIPDWKAQLASIVPGQRITGAPILVVQGKADTTVPAATTQTLVKRICGKDRVQYVEYDATGHGDSIKSGDRDIRAFIANRLAGAPFTPACS
jgi:pimeloyl-ACP methyl ester carboxylesterase